MSYAGYVIAGWLITFVVLAGYALLLLRRTRRAQELERRLLTVKGDAQ